MAVPQLRVALTIPTHSHLRGPAVAPTENPALSRVGDPSLAPSGSCFCWSLASIVTRKRTVDGMNNEYQRRHSEKQTLLTKWKVMMFLIISKKTNTVAITAELSKWPVTCKPTA